MSADFTLVAGLALFLFAMPVVLGAMIERTWPRESVGATAIGALMALWGYWHQAEGFGLSDIPYAVIRVLGALFN